MCCEDGFAPQGLRAAGAGNTVKAILHTQYPHGQVAIVDIDCPAVRYRPSTGIDNQTTEAGHVHGAFVRESAAVGCDGQGPPPHWH